MISNHWLYRWVDGQLSSGESLLINDRYYFPVGDAPWLAGNGSDAVPWALILGGTGWPGSITAWCLGIITLNGLGGLALARCMGARWHGAILAGWLVALCPYICHEMMGMRLSQAPLYWLLFFLSLWIRALEKEGRAALLGGVVAGVCFAATAGTYWYQGLWAGALGGLLWLAQRNRQALIGLAASAAVLVGPLLAIFLQSWDAIPGTSEEPFPHPLSIESSLPLSWPLWSGDVDRAEVTLSLVALAAAGTHIYRRIQTSEAQGRWMTRLWRALKPLERALLVGVLLFGLLALGPHLLWPDGTDTGIPGPFALVYSLSPALRRFWWPYRHLVMCLICLLPLAAMGMDYWLERLCKQPWARHGLALLLVILIPLEQGLRGGRLDVPISWFEAPVIYEKVADLPGEVILELPLAPELSTHPQTLSYQWIHGKRLVGGHAMWVERVRPDDWDTWVANNSFLSRLQQFERGELFGEFAFQPEDLTSLRESGVRYLVINAEYFPAALYGLVPAYQELLGQALGDPIIVFRDQLIVYDLEHYDFRGSLEAPEFRLPREYLEQDGSQMLELGYNRPQGWRTVARLFPPAIPPRGEAGELGEEPMLEAQQ
jgi:hypothetical protein